MHFGEVEAGQGEKLKLLPETVMTWKRRKLLPAKTTGTKEMERRTGSSKKELIQLKKKEKRQDYQHLEKKA